VDPAAEEYYGWSGYNYVMDSPVRLVDPDGRASNGIGVNEKGRVVYDDGKKDGNWYYFGSYDGEKFTSMEEVESKGISYEIALENYKVIDGLAVKSFVKASFRYIDHKNGEALVKALSDVSIEEKSEFKMQTRAYTDAVKQNGAWGARMREDGIELAISTHNKSLIDNIDFFRNVLAHESYHFFQAFRMPELYFKDTKAMTIAIIQAELAAYKYQMKHWTWDAMPDAEKAIVRRVVERYKMQLSMWAKD